MRPRFRFVKLCFVLSVVAAPAAWAEEDTAAQIKDDIKRSLELTDKERIKRDMKEKPGEAKIDCQTLRDETRSFCRDVLLRGLKGDCYMAVQGLKQSVRQAKSTKVYKGKDGAAVSNQKIADTACRVHVRSIRRARERHGDKMKPEGSAGPRCLAVAKRIEEACWPSLGSEDFPRKCETALLMSKVGRGDAEQRCEMISSALQ